MKLVYLEFLRQNLSINTLTPTRTQVSPFTEISILFEEGIIKKNSYGRRAHKKDKKTI